MSYLSLASFVLAFLCLFKMNKLRNEVANLWKSNRPEARLLRFRHKWGLYSGILALGLCPFFFVGYIKGGIGLYFWIFYLSAILVDGAAYLLHYIKMVDESGAPKKLVQRLSVISVLMIISVGFYFTASLLERTDFPASISAIEDSN